MARRLLMGQAGPALRWETAAIFYLSPGAFQVAGVDRSWFYRRGLVVCNPVTGKYAGVYWSEYAGGNTNVYLADAICTTGMGAIAYIPNTITWENLATPTAGLGGINGGICLNGYRGGYPATNAFDGDMSTWFQSNNTVLDATAIGYKFGSAVSPRWIRMRIGTSVPNPFTSYQWKYSSNGADWTLVSTFSVDPYADDMLFISTKPPAAHWWAMFPHEGTVGSDLIVFEMSMGN